MEKIESSTAQNRDPIGRSWTLMINQPLHEEPHQVPVHRLFGMLQPAVLGVVAEDAWDAERVQFRLQGRAEPGVVDALAGARVGGERGVGLGVEEDDGGIVGRGVSEG